MLKRIIAALRRMFTSSDHGQPLDYAATTRNYFDPTQDW